MVAAGSALLMVGLGACGGGSGNAADLPPRTINIQMRDISFSPSAVTIAKGEQIRFVFTNNGAVAHDAFIGNEMEQDAHEAEMRGTKKNDSMSGMDHGGASDGGITVQPGKTDEIVVTFAEKQKTIIGCHEAGHYAGGMKVAVTVE
ncbi:MAG TPA: plastocyanin/azurin family copper-binding protein [Acidimicrobiales bacterium]|nr:plastocyanin/azurin family copper-binding protein [Acidimicrobiales bacterium]